MLRETDMGWRNVAGLSDFDRLFYKTQDVTSYRIQKLRLFKVTKRCVLSCCTKRMVWTRWDEQFVDRFSHIEIRIRKGRFGPSISSWKSVRVIFMQKLNFSRGCSNSLSMRAAHGKISVGKFSVSLPVRCLRGCNLVYSTGVYVRSDVKKCGCIVDRKQDYVTNIALGAAAFALWRPSYVMCANHSSLRYVVERAFVNNCSL